MHYETNNAFSFGLKYCIIILGVIMKQDVSENIIKWYQENKRILPWRMDKDPYHVWISEVMLQQTRIEAVVNYYNRFMKELPTVFDLAKIDEDKLLKLWEGLGYYNRARNLKKCAIILVEKYNGCFPKKYDELINLPGVGEYTASAISSICFNEKESCIDGNVLRVFTRINNATRNISDKKVKDDIRKTLMENMPEDSGDFNEGLMELGEVICIPNSEPKCNICPVHEYCKAYINKTYQNLPVKTKKQGKKEEDVTVFLFKHHEKVAISKRDDKGLLANLWEFPNIQDKLSLKKVKGYLEKENISYKKVSKSIQNTHIFTHKIWNMSAYIIELENIENLNYIWVTKTELETKYAIPTAFEPFKKVIERK